MWGRVAVQRSAYGCGTELAALPSMCQIRTPIDVDMQVAMATVWGTTCDPHAGLEASWCLSNDAIATVHGQGAIALLHVDDMSRLPLMCQIRTPIDVDMHTSGNGHRLGNNMLTPRRSGGPVVSTQ